MFRLFLLAAMLLNTVSAFAQMPPPPQKGPRGQHPMMFALESDDFTAEERARLKKLAQEEPRKFQQEMRVHFIKKRKERAVKLLNLRNVYLNAKTDAEKKKALEDLKTYLAADTERHSRFQEKMIAESEKALHQMEQRLAEMKKKFEEQKKNKDAVVDKKIKSLTSGEVPRRLLRDANMDPNKMPPMRKGEGLPPPPPPPEKR